MSSSHFSRSPLALSKSCRSSDEADGTPQNDHQKHHATPSPSSSLSTKQNSFLTVHDIIQMTPHESQVETMVFSHVQQVATETTIRKNRGQSPLNKNVKHSLFDCIPDESLRYYIGIGTGGGNSTCSSKPSHSFDNGKRGKEHSHLPHHHHQTISASTLLFQKPDTIERRARSDTVTNTSTLFSTNHQHYPDHHLRASVIHKKTPIRSNRSTSNDARPKHLPPLARSSTMTQNNRNSHPHHHHTIPSSTTSQQQQLHHRHSNSMVSTASNTGNTLAMMAHQLDDFQNSNNVNHHHHDPFPSTSPSSSSLLSKTTRQSANNDTGSTIPSAVELMVIVPPTTLMNDTHSHIDTIKTSKGVRRMGKFGDRAHRPFSPLASKDYNVLTDSCWSLDDNDEDDDHSNDKDSLLSNPISPSHDTTILGMPENAKHTESDPHIAPSHPTVTCTTTLTTKAESDWIQKRKPANITVTTVEHDSDDSDDNNDSTVSSKTKWNSDGKVDDIEWGPSDPVPNVASPNASFVPPTHTTISGQYVTPSLRDNITTSMEYCGSCCRHPILLLPTNSSLSLHDLWYDFEIFVRQRQKTFLLYLRYFLLIVIPAIVIAFVMFYIAGMFVSCANFEYNLIISFPHGKESSHGINVTPFLSFITRESTDREGGLATVGEWYHCTREWGYH